MCEPVDGLDTRREQAHVPDLSREGPFDIYRDRLQSEATPRLCQGCPFRITSYNLEIDGSDFSPEYGVQLHDPRLLEYVGAPESARLLSRSPEYWVQHMGRGKTLSAALQLQHDAGFDFIECFTTTFLHAHSWLNWVDEDDDEHDEVGLKEKPEDTRYIKKITSK